MAGACVDPGQCLSLPPQCLYPLPSGFAESPPAGLVHTLSYRKFYALFKASAAPRSSHTWSVGCTLTLPTAVVPPVGTSAYIPFCPCPSQCVTCPLSEVLTPRGRDPVFPGSVLSTAGRRDYFTCSMLCRSGHWGQRVNGPPRPYGICMPPVAVRLIGTRSEPEQRRPRSTLLEAAHRLHFLFMG